MVLAVALPCCSAAGSKEDMPKIVKKLEILKNVDWASIKALIDSKQVKIDHQVIGGKNVDVADIVRKLVLIVKIDWKGIGQLMAKGQLKFDDTMVVKGKEVNTSRVLKILDYVGKIDWKSFGRSIGNNIIINLFSEFAPRATPHKFDIHLYFN